MRQTDRQEDKEKNTKKRKRGKKRDTGSERARREGEKEKYFAKFKSFHVCLKTVIAILNQIKIW